ncbi:dTDP-glucose 4,6-dehydratase [Aquiluna borgnonia]|uniref:dTDP-glucose 4,6-dehydratase n=1 Tax=Aquiluna borgnonia TaxID=2499157 RepID=A0A7D4TK44_9MICO|nr:dTDP-glucose 4,6-dehydratase [Aquiluna borgnonia]QKJ25052.1 dTDP-glucose 4,6-dehydratase [Aquiluna borgnonia]
MRVLVTGGAGFIGSNFVSRSISQFPNLSIIVLDSLTYAGKLANLEAHLGEIEFVHGDIRDSALLDQLVSRVDLVVHFAAESHNDNSLNGPRVFYETNVLGTLNLASACVKYGVRLHHVSTDEVFGDLPLDSELEFDVETPYNPSSPYSASKAASDQLVRAWVRSFGLTATISNCSNNYGKHQHWEKLIPATVLRIYRGERPKVYGDGKNVRDWIHVDDHTDGIWAVINKGEVGSTYLLGARDRKDNLSLVTGLLAAAKRNPSEIEFVEDRAGHDKKYAINPESAWRLGWRPNHSDIEVQLPELYDFYSSRARAEFGE